MRTLRSLVLSTICLIPSICLAFDVGYQLNDKTFVSNEEPKTGDPFAIAIADRVWAAPGIEQSNAELEPPRKYDFKNPTRLHIEADGRQAGDCDWLDDAAWPLTRELYGLGRSDEVFCQDVCQQEFTFGGVTLQR